MGHSVKDGPSLRGFLQGRVADRLSDTGEKAEMAELLEGLSLTGMGSENLDKFLAAEEPETRAWAISEALAEAFLEEEHGVVFPWNNERDKRTPRASLPGADIVGFQQEGGNYRLVIGEVKSSSEKKSPPGVMVGRSGMGHQLDTLADDLSILHQIMCWLFSRIKNTGFVPAFQDAMTRLLDSEYKDICIFGVLLRDRPANSKDLDNRGKALGKKLAEPTRVHLLALYLPLPIADLPQAILQAVP